MTTHRPNDDDALIDGDTRRFREVPHLLVVWPIRQQAASVPASFRIAKVAQASASSFDIPDDMLTPLIEMLEAERDRRERGRPPAPSAYGFSPETGKAMSMTEVDEARVRRFVRHDLRGQD